MARFSILLACALLFLACNSTPNENQGQTAPLTVKTETDSDHPLEVFRGSTRLLWIDADGILHIAKEDVSEYGDLYLLDDDQRGTQVMIDPNYLAVLIFSQDGNRQFPYVKMQWLEEEMAESASVP